VAEEHGGPDVQLGREIRDDRILALYAEGRSQRYIKEEVGCSLGHVNAVIKRFRSTRQ
jgi:transposase